MVNASDTLKPLRQNIRMLGDILGNVITTLEGKPILDKVAEFRELAQKARTGDRAAKVKLLKKIQALDDKEFLLIAKAFTQFLNLANISEQHHRIRRRLSYRRQKEPHPQMGSVEEVIPRLINSGINKKAIVQKIIETKIDFVLTAHPTETQRRTMMQKYKSVAEGLAVLDREDLTEEERGLYEKELHRTLYSAWVSDEIRSRKPTPVEEARWGFAIVEQSLWDTVPAFLRNLESVIENSTGQRLPVDFCPIRFSSWMGGDRDGNPNVTADVTREVLLLGQWKTIELLTKDIDLLRSEFSMTICSQELRKFVGNCREPYRVLLKKFTDKLNIDKEQIENALRNKRIKFKSSFTDADSLKKPLLLCYRSLVDTQLELIANGRLKDIIRKLSCFGRSLLKLDIRQDAQRHTKFLNSLTRKMNLQEYEKMSETERQKFILNALNSKKNILSKSFRFNHEDTEVLDTFKLVATEDSSLFGAYVISMAKRPSDILAVYLLQKLAGVKNEMRVVPLFETLKDLHFAGETIDRLLKVKWFKSRVNEIEVMIGYSDSSKDAGFLAASWAQYKAQEDIVKICSTHRIGLTFFHGRGGSIGRGGASAYQALLSQPPGASKNGLRVTEQGEVIRFKFGLPGIALRTLEVYLSATIEAGLCPPKTPKTIWRDTLDKLADESARVYRTIVKDNKLLTDYFIETTPIKELQKISISSRPAKRKGGKVIESLRAIPWVFGWTQVRLILPAWLGTQVIFDPGIVSKKLIREMLNKWVFFENLYSMQEMVLAKTLPDVTELYEKNLTSEKLHSIGKVLRKHLEDVKSGWLDITGNKELLADSPVIKRSIAIRNPYTDVLNFLQIESLKRYRNKKKAVGTELERALHLTIIGIAAGMRNTG